MGLAVLVGAVVQAGIGFGIVVVAAPLVIVFAPELMPGSMLMCGFFLPMIQLPAGPRHIDWPVLRAALASRLALTPVGVWIVAALSVRAISVMVALLVLAVALLSVTTLRVESRPRNALMAGAITGISGTAAAIGGPFLAMTLQHETPERIRSTLAAFFAFGSCTSMLALAIGGEFSTEQALAGLLFVPFLAVGYLAGAPVRRWLGAGRMRTFVLGFCVLASLSILIRAV